MYEFVEGGTLADVILEWQKLTPAERLSHTVPILHTIANAVGCGHAVSPAVVHRDLKPANVLMAGAVPRITDYGIGGAAAAFRVAEEKSRGYTTVMGRLPSMLNGSYSLLYSSPQQRDGDAPDPRDDVHALGVLAYQMLIGRVDAEVKGNWQKRLKGDGVPEALIDLIGNSASDEADDRPKDAREWASVLAELLPAQPQLAVTPPVPPTVPARPQPGVCTPFFLDEGPLQKSEITGDIECAARTPGETVEFLLPGELKMAFCWIPPGTAQLGSPVTQQKAVAERLRELREGSGWLAGEDETKRGKYTSKGFWLGKYPVTQGEWYALTGETPSYFRASGGGATEVKGLDTTRFPVEQVSWDMICGPGGFLVKLNAVGGAEKAFGKAGAFVLPHEDMWEYACRGGLGNQQPFYFGYELNGTQANINGNFPFGTVTKGPFLKRPCSVDDTNGGKYPLHPWGVMHMHGNVWEWCANLHSQTKTRVLRGGAWRSHGHRGCRAAFRKRGSPNYLREYIGFRIALSLDS